nr:hypothetical protein [Tanacetum cinerariifolium]
EVGYGITNSWDEIVETLQGAPVSTDTELGRYVREFEMRVRQDMDEIYTRLDDEQTERQLLRRGCPEKLGRERPMPDIGDQRVAGRRSQEADCDFRVTKDGSKEIYRDFRIEDSLTRADHSPIGIGDSLAGTCCYFTGTAGIAWTCWGPYIARATRGGWWQCID